MTGADHDYQTDESYSYDANGNRTKSGYDTGDNNQLLEDGTYSYEYDDEGNRTLRTNLTTSETTEYEWDYRNRLTRVTDKDAYGSTTQVVAYTYDAFNRRIARAVDTTSPFDLGDAAIERYVLDDVNGVTSLDGGNVILDFVDPDGPDGMTDLNLSKRYLYGSAVDQILAQEDVSESLGDDTRVLWPLGDHLQTTRDLGDQSGTIAEHYEFDSYGNVTAGDTSMTRYLFTAREFDVATGLQQNRARWYDAGAGRWMSEDPIAYFAMQSNLSSYLMNRATSSTDPSGKIEPWGTTFKGQSIWKTSAPVENRTAPSSKLLPGESVPPNFQPGGPSDIPKSLEGTWNVSICIGEDHAWIRFENASNPEIVRTLGRYQLGYGGRVDENGKVIIPPVAIPGVQIDQDNKKEAGFKKGMYISRTIQVTDPVMYKGPNPFGYGGHWLIPEYENNCATYARDAWYYYSGEWKYLPGPDLPYFLGKWIQQKNNPPTPEQLEAQYKAVYEATFLK